MNSNPKSTTEDTRTAKQETKGPLAATQPLFSDIWGKTQSAIDAPMPTDFIAGPTDAQKAGVGNMISLAPTLGANAGNLRDVAGKVANGFFLDPTNDPTFRGAASAAINPITQQLTERVLPQIVDQSIRNGGVGGGPAAYGGARQDIQENQAVRDWGQTAGDITAKMAADSRARGMALIPSAPALDAGATASALTPAQVLLGAGGQQQAWNQGDLQDTISKWLFPLTGLQTAAGIGSTGGYYDGSSQGSSVTTKTTPAPDMTTQWLQGITGGIGMASSLMGMPGMGSILGGLGGMFGGGAAGLPNMGLPAGQSMASVKF